MFEQQSYGQAVSEVSSHPGDLFYNYEIKNWDYSPHLYKILGISALLNIVALAVIGTSGLLTARGCDSPFVGRVCQVLDTVYVGSIIFGTDKEYADTDYTKTELEDADVTFIDVSGVAPPLTYPEGYFQLANPEQQFANVTDPMAGFNNSSGMLAPGIPANPTYGGSGLINTPRIAPKVNPNTVEGDLPTSPLGDVNDNPTVAGNGIRKGRRGGRPLGTDANANANVNTSNTNTDTVAKTEEPVDEAKQDQNGIYLNKRPLKDFAKDAKTRITEKNLQLEAPYSVKIAGELGVKTKAEKGDGKTVVLKNPKPVETKYDPEMVKLAQEAILAVGDSGWFGYLNTLGVKKIVITVVQDENEFKAIVQGEQESEERARKVASGLNNFISIGKMTSKGDELAFLEMASSTSDGKMIFLNFTMPKQTAIELIKRKLNEPDKPTEKPSGNASVKPSDSNTAER